MVFGSAAVAPRKRRTAVDCLHLAGDRLNLSVRAIPGWTIEKRRQPKCPSRREICGCRENLLARRGDIQVAHAGQPERISQVDRLDHPSRNQLRVKRQSCRRSRCRARVVTAGRLVGRHGFRRQRCDRGDRAIQHVAPHVVGLLLAVRFSLHRDLRSQGERPWPWNLHRRLYRHCLGRRSLPTRARGDKRQRGHRQAHRRRASCHTPFAAGPQSHAITSCRSPNHVSRARCPLSAIPDYSDFSGSSLRIATIKDQSRSVRWNTLGRAGNLCALRRRFGLRIGQ